METFMSQGFKHQSIEKKKAIELSVKTEILEKDDEALIKKNSAKSQVI
jgi:hypothetical protein